MKKTVSILLLFALLFALLPACSKKGGTAKDAGAGRESETISPETGKESDFPSTAPDGTWSGDWSLIPPDSETGTAPSSESETAFSPASEGMGITLSIREDAALKLLSDSLPSDTPYQIGGLRFAEPNLISISGTLDLKKLSESYNLGITDYLPAAEVPFETTASFLYSSSAGIALTPVSLSVMSFSLPMDFLPPTLFKPFADSLNQELSKLPLKVTSITVEKNALVLMG